LQKTFFQGTFTGTIVINQQISTMGEGSEDIGKDHAPGKLREEPGSEVLDYCKES